MKEDASKIESWCKYDFTANKYYWEKVGYEKALPVRVNNLSDIFDLLNEFDVEGWLQGKTLFGIHKHGKLLNDHDDDIGVWKSDWNKVEHQITIKLFSIGFKVIRNNENIISFLRNERYIDVCKFQEKGKRAGYGTKWFLKYHFDSLEELKFSEAVLKIPSNSDVLLRNMYNPTLRRRLYILSKSLFTYSKYSKLYKLIVNKALELSPHYFRSTICFFFNKDFKYQKLSKKQFLDLLIEPIDSFNWKWRKPHLDVVTNNGSEIKIGDIKKYFLNSDTFENVENSIIETDTSFPFHDPANFDRRFWQSGNNFFYYCIKYQFKKDVVPYSKANEYIKEGKIPDLFTTDYYESLPAMSDDEIKLLLKNNPIEVTNGAITSGKHRAFAMIGRLIANQSYIPFWAIIKN